MTSRQRTTSPPHPSSTQWSQLRLCCKSLTPGHVLEAVLSPGDGALHYFSNDCFMTVRFLTRWHIFLLDSGCSCYLLSIPTTWFKLCTFALRNFRHNLVPPWINTMRPSDFSPEISSHLWNTYTMGQLLYWKIRIQSWKAQTEDESQISSCHKVINA